MNNTTYIVFCRFKNSERENFRGIYKNEVEAKEYCNFFNNNSSQVEYYYKQECINSRVI